MEDSHQRQTIRYDYGSTSDRNDSDDAVVGLPVESEHPRSPQRQQRHYRSCPNSPLLSPLHHQQQPHYPPMIPPGWLTMPSSAGVENEEDDEGSSLIPTGMRVSWSVIDAGPADDASPLSHSSAGDDGGSRGCKGRSRRSSSGGHCGAAGGHHHHGSSKKNSVLIASLAIFACAYVWLTAVAYLSSPSEAEGPRGSPTGIPVDPPPSIPPQGTEDGAREELEAEHREEQEYYRGSSGKGKKFPFIKRQRSVVLRRRGDEGLQDGGPTDEGGGSDASSLEVTVLVVYGPADTSEDPHPHIATMASEVARGASSYLSSSASSTSTSSSSQIGGTVKLLDVSVATFDDVLDADAIIVGSVVYNANVHPDVQSWFDDVWDIDRRDELQGKIGAAFVTAGGVSAGQESVTFDLLRDLMVMGLAVVGGETWEGSFGAQAVVGEGPFAAGGGSSGDDGGGDLDVDDLFLQKAFGLGRRVADVASVMRLGDAAAAAAASASAAVETASTTLDAGRLMSTTTSSSSSSSDEE